MENEHASVNSAEMQKNVADRLMASIGILQCIYTSADSPILAERIWGTHYMPNAGLEHAISILIDVLGDIDA